MIWFWIAVPFIVVSLAATALCVGSCMMSSRVSQQEAIKKPARDVLDASSQLDTIAKAS